MFAARLRKGAPCGGSFYDPNGVATAAVTVQTRVRRAAIVRRSRRRRRRVQAKREKEAPPPHRVGAEKPIEEWNRRRRHI